MMAVKKKISSDDKETDAISVKLHYVMDLYVYEEKKQIQKWKQII